MKSIPKILLFVLSLCCFPLPVIAKECLVIANTGKTHHFVMRLIPDVKKAMEFAGLCATIVTMPAIRIQNDMRKGVIDGEFVRVISYIREMKDSVIHVPTPIVEGRGFIVTLRESGFKPSGIGDVENQRIGYIRNVKWHEKIAARIKNTQRSSSYENLARLLKAGRIKGVLTDNVTLSQLLQSENISKNEIYISYPVMDLFGYLVLHKKNADLLHRIDKALKQVIAQGGFRPGSP